jgi:hypothetical protein
MLTPRASRIVHDQARWRANLLRKTRMAMAAVSIDVKEKSRKKTKIKGGFYVFNPPEKRK